MKVIAAVFRREWRLRIRGGGWAASVGLFAVAGSLSPLALGRDPDLLAAAAPAILWIATLFSVLIALDGLYEEDVRTGGLALYRLSTVPLPVVVLTKTVAVWITGCGPLLLVAPVLLLAFGAVDPVSGALGFLLGTPGLVLVSSAVGAFCAGMRRGTALLVFLSLPLLAPALVFGPASAGSPAAVPLLVLGAFSLQAVAICPFVAAAALKAQMS